MNQKLIICVIGLPGAGKSLFCSVSNELGFSIINMGDQVRKEIKKQGLSDDAETLSKMMVKLRKYFVKKDVWIIVLLIHLRFLMLIL